LAGHHELETNWWRDRRKKYDEWRKAESRGVQRGVRREERGRMCEIEVVL